MQFDVRTAMFASASIIAAIGLATLLFSLERKENRPFIWAAMGSCSLATTFGLLCFRGMIPDFFSIIVANGVALFAFVAFYEVIRRLLSIRPWERYVGPWLLVLQTSFFIWYTYYQYNFQARVLIISFSVMIMCAFTIKLLLANSSKAQRVSHIFAVMPFAFLFLLSAIRIAFFLTGQSQPETSLTSPPYPLFVIYYGISSGWVALASVFIVSNRLQTQVIGMALTDPLTGVLNRRAIKDAAEREIARAERNSAPLSFIITDLDHFKKVNDKYGHQAGDAVLVHVVSLFKEILRDADLLARFGGEEFMIVLSGSGGTEAISVAERLRQAIKTNTLVFEKQPIPITSSFGVAGYNRAKCGYEELVKQADRALYKAKEEGRDRVILFDSH